MVTDFFWLSCDVTAAILAAVTSQAFDLWHHRPWHHRPYLFLDPMQRSNRWRDFGFNPYSGGFSPIRHIVTFFDCPVFTFFDPMPRSNQRTNFHALWLKRHVSAQVWSFWGGQWGFSPNKQNTAPTVPIETKICMAGNIADVITCAVSRWNFWGYDFTGGQISHFPIDYCMGLTTVQRFCAACDG